jgi:hypothetical protein
MNPDETLFSIWAPDDAVWSAWAKPPAFIGAHRAIPRIPTPQPTPPLPETSQRGMAVVIDLPGAVSVRMALAFAERGFRPVPLFNACRQFDAFVNLTDLVHALMQGAPGLQQLRLPPDAPPAFLLDANRLGRGTPKHGQYDNRSIVLPQDFPSAARLKAHRLTTVLLCHAAAAPAKDLTHILRRWQEGGVTLLQSTPASGPRPGPLHVSRPFLFRSILQAWIAQRGLRRSSAGGFGAPVPLPSEGGYGGGGGRFG